MDSFIPPSTAEVNAAYSRAINERRTLKKEVRELKAQIKIHNKTLLIAVQVIDAMEKRLNGTT